MPPVQPQPGVSLDGGPPLPPDLQRPSMRQMAGEPQADAGNPAAAMGAGAQKAALEKLMLGEKSLRDAAGIIPQLAPVIDAAIATLRSGAAKVMMSSQAAPPSAPASPSPMGAMAGGVPGAAA